MTTHQMTPLQQQAHDSALRSDVAVGFLVNAAVRDARKLTVEGRPGRASWVLTRAGMRIARLSGEPFKHSPEYLDGLEAAGLGQP